ncbi:DNA/RNA non-specific endonuclease [Kitasatospora sp. NPDC051914]|uniref:DNA/RNA non-specific endonuclease n=1 Tax=Kitasatospora sp. NPDC051914 TaxID=3154945 RepID=UPI00343A1071
MTAHPHQPAARCRRTVRHAVLLVLAAVLVPIVGTGTRASATTGATAVTAAAAVAARPGTVAPLVPFGGIEAASAALAREVEDFNRQEAELAQQAKDVVAEAEEITKNAAALRNDTAALTTRTAAVEQKSSSFNARAAALSARINAHNGKPHTFRLPAQAAAANAYEAEASQLRAEQARLQAEKSSLQNERTQLEEERSRLNSRQSRLTAASTAHDAKAGALRNKEQQLQSRGQQLLQQMAQAVQGLVEDPPDPAATMDQGGDAAGPPQHDDQPEGQGADTADSPSRQPQTSALKAYAKQTGSTVDLRPGTAYLTPEAVGRLPAAQAAQLGSPSITYDGLVRKPDGHYTALRVQTPEAATAAPGQEAFRTALTRRGQLVAYRPGTKLIIDEFKPVPAAPNVSDPGAGTPPTPPAGEAACLVNKPPSRRDSGGGWIVNTTQAVARRNKIADPTGPSGTRAATAEACLTKPLGGGTDAAGDITGWEDARTQAPGGGLARCHLIANVLGGRGGTQADWANLVPCWQLGMNIKGVSMRHYEILVKKVVDALPEGAAVHYVVTPLYRDATSTIPQGASMSATVQLPNGASWPVFYTTSLVNVPHDNGPNLGN